MVRYEGDVTDDEPDPIEPEWRFVNGEWVQWQYGDEEIQTEGEE